MKRLIITEDEKDRILGMHKSVFYEQVVPPTSGITTPANTTMGVMGDVRQQQRQQRQDLRQQQGAERKDLRQAAQDVRQGERQANQDARQAQRQFNQDTRQAERQQNQDARQTAQDERQAERELARTQRQADRAARKEARQERRDIRQTQSEIADYENILRLYSKSKTFTTPKPEIGNITYNQYYQNAIDNLKANLQAQGVK
jgi:hypothetical protein